jgi:AcrR family transcriptional regulator
MQEGIRLTLEVVTARRAAAHRAAPRAAPDERGPKERVLDAAMTIIVERGLDQLRLSEIATRTRMSTGHVLYYFGTKDRILIETLQWKEQELAERRRLAIDAAKPGWEQLRVFIEHYLPRNADDPVWALWVEMWARRHRQKHVPLLRRSAAGWEQDLDAILKAGRRAGEFAAVGASFGPRLNALMNGFAVQVLERTRKRDEVVGLVLDQCRLELQGVAPGRKRR